MVLPPNDWLCHDLEDRNLCIKEAMVSNVTSLLNRQNQSLVGTVRILNNTLQLNILVMMQLWSAMLSKLQPQIQFLLSVLATHPGD